MLTRRLRPGLGALLLSGILASMASGSASGATFDRAWGKDVGGTGVGLCTVAANCLPGALGGLGGEFNSPSAVATDPAGNVYVADTFNERVEKFDASGTFLRAWGKNVGGAGVGICTVAASCQPGVSGPLGGEFNVNGPDGIATDAAGNVYVTEFYGHRIQKFDSSGNFLRAWGKNVGGVGVGLCTLASSCQAGSSGGLGGELFGPQSIATDPAGNLYVTESSNNRIQKFDSSGNFLRAWGKNVGGSGVGLCTVASSCQAGNVGGLGNEFANAFGIATDGSANVYVTDANIKRVQKFDSSGAFQRAWGKDVGGPGVGICTVAASCQPGVSGAGGGDFNANGPSGVTTDAAGHVYVVNTATGGRVQEFDGSGAFVQAWGKDVGGVGVAVCTVAASCQVGSTGALGGEFTLPVGIAASADGALYVTDYGNRRIQRFGPPVAPPGPVSPVVTTPPTTPPAATPATAAAPAAISAARAFVFPSSKACVSRRSFRIRISKVPGVTFVSAVVKVNGKRVKTVKRARITAPVDLKGLPKGRFKVSITATASDGRTVTDTRRYRTCVPRRR